MNPKKKLLLLIGILIVILGTGVVAYYSKELGICTSNNGCFRSVAYGYGEPILKFIGAVLVFSSLMLLFGNKMAEFYTLYAVIIVPLLLIGLFTSPMDCVGGLFICFDRTDTALVTAILFVAISALVILLKGIQLLILNKIPS